MEVHLFDGLYSAGIFDSAFTFPDIGVTEERTVTCYELEFFAENGGITYINGVPYKISGYLYYNTTRDIIIVYL